MKKIIFYTKKSIQEYCFTFSCRFNTGLFKFNIKSFIDILRIVLVKCWRQPITMTLIFVLFLLTGYNVNAQNIKGIIPVQQPTNGSGVDGDAWAHEPTGTNFEPVGDLFDRLFFLSGQPISGSNPPAFYPVHAINHGLIDPATGSVLYKPNPVTNPPTPQNIPVTYQIKDRYIDDLTIFTLSNKINDNPNTYTWGAGSSPNKNEIQNCGAHFSYGDPNLTGGVTNAAGNFIGASVPGDPKDLWCLFAGDRQVTNGSSYIDFEFLQAPLTITGATYGPIDPFTGVASISGGSGAFHSEAPAATGGRTPGDILITIEFTQGGGDATVVIQEWTLVSGTYQYQIVGNNAFPNQIFCTNNNVTTTVPFDVYGVNPGTYTPNQWAEGAINLTKVLTYLKNPCTSISTLFIRTRSSGNSSQSELKDFPGAPIQLNLDFRPGLPTTTGITVCGPGPVQVNLAASGCEGGTLKWYDAATDGTKVYEGLTYSPTISITTSYWVSCTKNDCEGPRAQVTATVNTINPGIIAGNQTLCSPFDPVAFTNTTSGSASEGGAITYQWQMSTNGCDGTWGNIVGATSATYDASAVSVITNFRRVTSATLNSVACSANSNCLTITPEDIHPGEIAGSQTLCTPFNPAAFTSVTPGSNGGTISYQWQSSITSCESGFSNITDATSATYDAPAVAVTTYFRRVATTSLNGAACSANSNCLTVTPNAINPGTIAGGGTLCTPFNPAAFTSTTAGTGGGTISYQWQSSTTSCESGFSNITDATSATYDAPAVAVTTYFRRVATSTLNGVACSANSNCLTITPEDIHPGEIAGSQTLCTPFNPAAFTSVTPGSNGGTISYQWQSSITSCESGFSNITDATSVTYDAPAVAVTTYFRRVATTSLNGAACSANSNCLTVTPNAINPGVIAGSQTLCTPFNPAAFTSTTAGTGGGTISYQWQSSTTSCEAGFSNITDATSATYDAPAVAVTTYFRRVSTSTLNGVACSANSNCLTVTPNAVTPGTIAGSQTLCTPADPAAFTSTTAGTGGGTISYQWQSSTTSCEAGFSNIADATSATYNAPTVSGATYFRRVATSTLNGVACSANSNCLTITPEDIHPGEIAGSQTLCTPFNPAAFTSVTPGSNGGTISYQWQSSITSCESGFSNITDATSVTYDAPAVAVTTYFRRVATTSLNGAACSANSNCLTVTPNAINPGTIAGGGTLCTPFNPAAFTSTTAGTGGGTISYQWQISTVSCESGFSNITDATSATYDAPAVAVTTYFRRVATSILNGVACSANSNCLTVTPNAIDPGVIAGNQTVCIGDDPAAFTSTTAGTGGGTISYQWQTNTTGCGSDFTNIEGAISATYDPGVATVTTYYRRVTTSTLNGVVCSDNSNCLTVTAEICGGPLCTYTQGAYGNSGGKYCDGTVGGISTTDLITQALNNAGGSITIGQTGNSVFMNLADVSCIIDVMPGGGKASELAAGDVNICSLPNSYLKNGKINNVLLSQTIAMALNINITSPSDLGSFVLQAGTLATAKPIGGCGTSIPKERVCGHYVGDIWYDTVNEYTYRTFSAAVIDAITPDGNGNKTIAGLLDLANRALANVDNTKNSEGGAALSDIAGAAGAVNEVFDECAISMGWDKTPCPEQEVSFTETARVSDTSSFTVSPVPFKEQITVSYSFDYVTDVKIEVFNILGSVVASNYDTNGYLSTSVLLNIPSTGQEEVYIVKVTTNRGSSTQKVISSN
jgi:hypothetical protein